MPPRRGRPTLSRVREALRNRGGLPGELFFFALSFCSACAQPTSLFISLKTLQQPATAWLNTFAQPLYVADAVGAESSKPFAWVFAGATIRHDAIKPADKKRISIFPLARHREHCQIGPIL